MRIIAAFLVAWVALGSPRSHASIAELKQINIDFTSPRDAETKATWSEPDQIMVSRDGLGWDGDAAVLRDGWIQTKPLALGFSWRPAFGMSVRVAIQPPPHEFALNNGQKTTPYAGDVYVRYSPDLKHWSSWQSLQRAEPQSIEEKKKPGRHYSGTVSVPYRERTEYGKLIADYSRLDVPWKSDEEAAVKWILDRDPEFFSKRIPFIGYVEFLFEAGFYGGQRIQSFKAEIGYGIGGEALLPRDDAVSKNRDVPWRYKDVNDSKVEPTGEAGDSEWPKGATLEVQLSLSATVGTNSAVKISGDLLVKNPSAATLTIQNPRNRLALAFLVFDPLGNPVAPAFRGKVDPAFQTHTLTPHAIYTHHFDGLEFITGSAWLSYDLSPDKTYKIVAVYRPAGPSGPGFASQEVSLELGSVVHQAIARSVQKLEGAALQYQQIRVGMSRDEVYQLLGKPQGSMVEGAKDVITEIWVAPPDSQGQKIRLTVLFWADGRAHQVEQDILK
jgi:hypothetical protein